MITKDNQVLNVCCCSQSKETARKCNCIFCLMPFYTLLPTWQEQVQENAQALNYLVTICIFSIGWGPGWWVLQRENTPEGFLTWLFTYYKHDCNACLGVEDEENGFPPYTHLISPVCSNNCKLVIPVPTSTPTPRFSQVPELLWTCVAGYHSPALTGVKCHFIFSPLISGRLFHQSQPPRCYRRHRRFPD